MMLSRTQCLSLALVFGIVGQSFGFSRPAAASVPSTVSSRPAAISPLSSPLGSPDIISPTPVSDLPTDDVSVPTPSADDTASEAATPIVNSPDSPDAIESIQVLSGTVQSLCKSTAQMQTPLGTNVGTMSASPVMTTSLAIDSSGSAVQCTLTATDDQGNPLSQFNAPITFTFSVSNLVQWSALPAYLQPWIAISDTLSGTWQTLTPTMVDRDQGLIAVQLDAPATLAVGNEGVEKTGWVLTYDDAKVDTFSGGLSWQYDFPLPAGPGGVKPTLTLSYNSRRIDGIGSDSPSGQEGLGWELGIPVIEWRGFSGEGGGLNLENSLMLTINGISVRVIPTWPVGQNWQYNTECGRNYVTEEEQHWQLHWKCGPNGPGYANSNGDSWEVITQDGTRYRFGTSDDSRQVQVKYGTPITSRWLVKEIRYPTGVTVNYTYTPLTRGQQCQVWSQTKPAGRPDCGGSDFGVQREVLLQEMTYPGVRVRFGWDTRWNGNGPSDLIEDDNDNGAAFQSWSIYALQGITLEQQVTGTVYTPVQSWQLAYGSVTTGDSDPRAVRVLQGLQTVAFSGTQSLTLPATLFSYASYINKVGECNDNCSAWDKKTYHYPRLTRIDSGYGAVMTAGYETPDSGSYHLWNYRLAWRETNDGLGNVKRETYTYSYDRCYRSHFYTSDLPSCDDIVYYDATHHETRSGGTLVGYGMVTQTITQTVAGVGTNQFLQRVSTQYALWGKNQDLDNMIWGQVGRPLTQTTWAADGTVVQQVGYTWAHTMTYRYEVSMCSDNSPFCKFYYRAGEVWLQQQAITQGGRTTQTSYGYDSYGNITRTLEAGFVDVTGDERLTERGYVPNTISTTWIVDKPAWESVYEGSTADAAKLKGRTRYTYDGATSYTTAPTKGLLTRIEQGSDALSVAQTTGYDAWGNAVVMTDARGFTSTASYDGWNHSQVLTTTDALGHPSRYEYYGMNEQTAGGSGPVGTLKTVYDANGVATRYAYDAFGRLTGVVKPGDSFSLPTTQYLYADTTYTQTVYEAESAAYTHPCGTVGSGTWVSAYASFDYPASACWLSTGPSQVPVRVGPGQTARFRLAIQQNAHYNRAVATIEVYDSSTSHSLVSRLLYDTDFRGGFDRPADYDLVFDTTGLAGHSLEYRVRWEGRGQVAHDKTTLLWTLDQPLKIETQQREVSGCVTCTQVAQVYYNGLGQAIQQRGESATSAQQVVVDTRYDGLGRVAISYVPTFTTSSTTFARLSGWDTRPKAQTQYDALGRTVAVTNADGMVTQMGYLGTTTIVTDANGHRKDSVADAYGRLQAVVEYSGTTAYTTRYAYDILGNLRVVTDTLGNTTVITYDALGRKVGMRDPDMGAWTYAYDANGNLITQTDALRQTAWFGYDKLNRLIEKRQGSSSGTVLAQYEYDQGTNGIGHRSAMTNTSAMMRWTYDVRGRVGIETKAITGITGTFSNLWQYDALDQVTQTRLPNGEVVTTTYDMAGHPATLNAGSQTLIASATYNALGSPQIIASSNGVQTRYAYFGLDYQASGNIQFFGELRQICVTTSNCALGAYTGTLMNLAYGYDNVGNVTTLQDDTNHQKETFTYDPLDRLVSATPGNIGVTTLNYTQTYSYNAIGNFVTKAGVTQVYSTTQPHAVRSLSNGSSFAYDANGNMTRRTELSGMQLITYAQGWDIDNRLVVVTNTNANQVTQYFYDADGNRVKRISPQGTTVYVNADYEVTGPSQMVVPTSTLPPTYTHKLYLPVVFCSGCNGIPSLNEPLLNLATARVTYRFNGQQVAMREGVTLTFVYGDHLGSASVTANISGTKVSEVRYYPFGETRYSSGTTPTSKRFTSQEEQVGIGLYDYGARFYDPAIGRFISADSVVPRPGDSQALNRYTYARNSPLVRVDPSGHGDCNVHTTSGCFPWNVDPVFVGGDFLSSINPIGPTKTTNPYDLDNTTTSQVQNAAHLFNVPPLYIAAALNAENRPDKLPWGAFTRAEKQYWTPALQILFPQWDDSGLGWSQGPANVKPGRARELEQYYLDNYDSNSPQYKFINMLHVSAQSGKLPEASPSLAAYYVASAIRKDINDHYGYEYNGPISEKGAAIVIGSHSQNGWYYTSGGDPSPQGAYGAALIVNASRGEREIAFLGQQEP